VFGERVTWVGAAGIGLIIVGVVVLNLSGAAHA
jgi:multidrug transporter EmrE-like cation transporter